MRELSVAGSCGRISSAYLLFAAVLPTAATGQDRPPPAVAALYVGAGNEFGWIGIMGEYVLLQDRVSGIVGIGVFPPSGRDFPANTAGSVGVRFYIGGRNHRAFAEPSVSLLGLSQPTLPPGVESEARHYGPALSLGYSYASNAGVSVTVGAGLGWARDELVPVAHFGLGWTWRRRAVRSKE